MNVFSMDRICGLLHLHTLLSPNFFFQNHTPIGRAVKILETFQGRKLPYSAQILNAYLHFESLTDHNYQFACFHCGESPPVLVLDGNRKASFKLNGMLHAVLISICVERRKWQTSKGIIATRLSLVSACSERSKSRSRRRTACRYYQHGTVLAQNRDVSDCAWHPSGW